MSGPSISPAPHSWKPQSLIAITANPPEPPTIGGLLYPAKRTVLSGETESLKTFAALILCKAEMDADLPVAWVDLDAMGAGELLARLRALGVADDVINKLFLYYEPNERLIADLLAEVCADIAERRVRLFVIDAFNPMLNLHGLDPNSTSDVETFWREVATPLTAAGAAPTLLDHVAKNAEGRGKYAIGSERKASGAIVHVGFRLIDAFTRGGTGKTLLTTHKDRPGYLPRPTIGRLVLTSNGDQITYEMEADHSRSGDTFRPTKLMERVSIALEGRADAVSQNWIEVNVKGKVAALRIAVETLTGEGYVSKESTSRGWEVRSIRPYREVSEADLETSSPPRPYLVPDLRSVAPDPTSSPRPLLLGDEDEGRSSHLVPVLVPRSSSSPVEDRQPDEWLARDGVWRSFTDEPPHWPTEIIETRNGDASTDSEYVKGDEIDKRKDATFYRPQASWGSDDAHDAHDASREGASVVASSPSKDDVGDDASSPAAPSRDDVDPEEVERLADLAAKTQQQQTPRPSETCRRCGTTFVRGSGNRGDLCAACVGREGYPGGDGL